MTGPLDKCLRAVSGGTLIKLHLQPGAKRSAVIGMHGDSLKVAIQAPPVDGRANAGMIALLAETLGAPRSGIAIRSGELSREKTVFIAGFDPGAIKDKLMK